MKSQDKDVSIGSHVESKKGERRSLSCNRADVRSPFLDFSPSNDEASADCALDYLADMLVEIYLYEQSNRSE